MWAQQRNEAWGTRCFSYETFDTEFDWYCSTACAKYFSELQGRIIMIIICAVSAYSADILMQDL